MHLLSRSIPSVAALELGEEPAHAWLPCAHKVLAKLHTDFVTQAITGKKEKESFRSSRKKYTFESEFPCRRGKKKKKRFEKSNA